MIKLNRLLYTTTADVFHDAVVPTAEHRAYLERCRNDIRDHLKKGIGEASVKYFGLPHPIIPRFRTQGSWSYNTCIQPSHLPPQEMDWDYGVYLPLEVWEKNGPPKEMAKKYFDLVETLLQSLCDKNGWELVPGKDTCIRVQVAMHAHMDIPLYAAPAEQFVKIYERAILKSTAAQHNKAATAMDSADADQIDAQDWDELRCIAMATREGIWKESDPEKVSRWFRAKIGMLTPQLQRICRYVKAYRDHHWKEGGPSSIVMMIAIAQQFKPAEGRDDLALEQAAEILSKALQGEVREAGIDEGKEDFNAKLDYFQKLDAAAKFNALAKALRQCRNSDISARTEVVRSLKIQLGERIPNRPDLIEVDTQYGAAIAVPARKVVQPVVGSSSAG